MSRTRSALLISPPLYDSQYWAHWSLPYGLLRVASWLKQKGYVLKLIDCLESNKTRTAKKTVRKLRKLCSTEESNDIGRIKDGGVPDDWKVEYCFGHTMDELRNQLLDLRAARPRIAFQGISSARRDLDFVDHDVLVGKHARRDCRMSRGFSEGRVSGRRHLSNVDPRTRHDESRS